MTDTTTRSTDADLDPANETITVIAWRDQEVEAMPEAIATASDETLLFLCPILGPTATLMAHRFAGYLASVDHVELTTADVARTFGMGNSTARLRASLQRLDTFGVAKVAGQVVAVRLALPPLPAHRRRQLPGYLAVEYWHRHTAAPRP